MMKKLLSSLFIISLLFVLCSPAYGDFISETYYIDSVNGDNENDGKSESSPYKDFTNLLDVKEFNAGDKILLKRGSVFSDSLIINGTGTVENPILISTYGEGDNPVFSASNSAMFFPVLIRNASNVIFENVDFKDCDLGLFIYPMEEYDSENITIRNCNFTNICYHPDNPKINNPCIYISTDDTAKLHGVHIHDVTMINCGLGIETKGVDREGEAEFFIDENTSYNYDFLFENIYMENLRYDGIILGSLRDSTVRNCRLIRTCQSDAFVTAPLWTHHCDNVMMEYCEIAGSNGGNDGMAIDFDGWSTNCTYQYIYSHDNKRFMRNCLYDSDTHNRNNTVRYCLSVNDNRKMSFSSYAIPNVTGIPTTMDNFTFCNNTLINCSPIMWLNLKNVTVKDNIFVGKSSTAFTSLFFMPISFGTNTIEGNVCQNFNSFTFCKNNIKSTPDFVGGDEYDMNSYKLSEGSDFEGKGCFTEESISEMAKIPVK